MSNKSNASLWQELTSDISDASLYWQLGVVLLCLALGWGVASFLRARLGGRDAHAREMQQRQPRVVRWGMESFAYVLAPLFTSVLLLVGRNVLAQWHHVHIVRMALALMLSYTAIRLSFYIFRRIFARGGAGSVLLIGEKVFATLVWCGVAMYVTGVWPEFVNYLEDIVLPVGRNKISLLTILQGCLSVSVTVLLAMWGGALLEDRLMRLNGIHTSLRVVMSRTSKALLILVAVLVSLSAVGIDLTVLSVFGGALGVGIGLGLQRLVSSYVSGFVILIERSMTIGDMVSVDKFYGKVTNINTRFTVLQGLDGVETVVPNEVLISSAVQNHSLSSRTLRLSTTVSVAYQTDIEALLPMLEAAAGKVPRILASPAPAAMLVRFGADGLDLEIGFWINDPENGRGGAVSDVNRAIWKLLQEKQISVPYPQREVRLLNPPESWGNKP